jgi:hypothetical protein
VVTTTVPPDERGGTCRAEVAYQGQAAAAARRSTVARVRTKLHHAAPRPPMPPPRKPQPHPRPLASAGLRAACIREIDDNCCLETELYRVQMAVRKERIREMESRN